MRDGEMMRIPKLNWAGIVDDTQDLGDDDFGDDGFGINEFEEDSTTP
jgi:hypothetical protein